MNRKTAQWLAIIIIFVGLFFIIEALPNLLNFEPNQTQQDEISYTNRLGLLGLVLLITGFIFGILNSRRK